MDRMDAADEFQSLQLDNPFTEDDAVVFITQLIRYTECRGFFDEYVKLYIVQGTVEEWVTRDEVRSLMASTFKDILLNKDYVRVINEMVSANKCSLEIDLKFLNNVNPFIVDCKDKSNSIVRFWGVVTKCSGVLSQLQQVKYDCSKCGAILGLFSPNLSVEWKLDRVLSVKQKGHLLSILNRNFQKLTLQESPEMVSAGRLPRSQKVILFHDLIGCAHPGEEIVSSSFLHFLLLFFVYEGLSYPFIL
ncbi:hypothetical protein RJT34_02919 [Clitoria ternatea]|uniref:MCM OB domain-containing protein n=1 Tax=Clitoria ternatea TaxID=43366 RepID=A0AAN9KHY2_CLITE